METQIKGSDIQLNPLKLQFFLDPNPSVEILPHLPQLPRLP
ncbi:hypothetical protein MC7420_2227 [Coleofasciculus chthonoplastes PCC 7420]|uniref:Uncharacterized protein n=1 Tax=Coleofasciculus chthonoplastes PCC 7420 TaxID=118168 RepID=B4VSM3_9CYAN|nr:hypothetical protein MC7420_2227 [Coleofasciculus chthonoplastes PCC 7420]